jgi:hypothetical protein
MHAVGNLRRIKISAYYAVSIDCFSALNKSIRGLVSGVLHYLDVLANFSSCESPQPSSDLTERWLVR